MRKRKICAVFWIFLSRGRYTWYTVRRLKTILSEEVGGESVFRLKEVKTGTAVEL